MRAGSCFDNAAAESFNAILKKELTNRKAYPTRNHAARDVTAWIELRYNHKRHPLDHRLPDPQPSRHRIQPTPQGSSLKPIINHCPENLYRSCTSSKPVTGAQPTPSQTSSQQYSKSSSPTPHE
ncbi:integrase core domain-containing protein [Propionibacterium australiense]|uniref:integrase core domain-containing protein n=1 Tax=Propionibacterium australiense TaxID=119981 RepID=UPI00147747B7